MGTTRLPGLVLFGDPADEQQRKDALERFSRALAHWSAIGKQINVKLASGDTTVRHGLGREPQGWIVLECQFEGDGPPPVATRGWDAETITFVADADVTLEALVF